MNKKTSVIAAVLLFSILWGCGIGSAVSDTTSLDELSASPQLVSNDYNLSKFDDNNNMYFECYGNTWSLTEDSSGVYPKLVSSLKKIDDNEKSYFKKNLKQYDKEAKAYASEHNGSGFECYANTGIACADPKVVSLVKTQLTFFGGAHPDTVTIAYNMDSRTGKFILLSDVIKDQKGLSLILAEALTAQYGDHQFFGLEDTLNTLEMNVSPFDEKNLNPQYIYSFNPDGLTFYFNPAVLSPYSDGGEQVNLSYEDLSSVMNEEYAP